MTMLGVLAPTAAAQSNQDLVRRIQAMEQKLQSMQEMQQELQLLKQQLAKSQQKEVAKTQKKEQEISELKKKVAETQRKAENAVKQANVEDTRSIKWHFAGYGTANFTSTDANDQHDAFGGGDFNPIFLIGYKDLLLFESEAEFSAQTDGSTKTQIEFANLNLNATDWLTLTAGKFLSPIGDFQQHLHPTWINKLPDRPAGFFEDGGNEALTEVGVMARGAFPVGSMTLDYAIFGGNGPRLSDVPDEGVLLEGFGGGDNNGDKDFGGRIGLRPLPYISIGVSGMHAKVRGNDGSSGAVTKADYDLEDVDAAFTKGYWDIRGEYIRAHLDSLMTAFDPANPTALIPGTTWRSWYAQIAYRLEGIADRITSNEALSRVLSNFEPVFRYSTQNVHGFSDFKANEEDRWTVGLDYWFAPSLVFKMAYENRDFNNKSNEDVFRAQFAYGF